MSLIAELKRRNVFRVGVAYVVAAWLILQLTEVLSELMELESDVGKIVIILLVVGFIPALIFAWAFELTPDGVKREKDVDRSQSISHQTGPKLDFIIIATLGLVVAWFVFDKFFAVPIESTNPAVNQAAQPEAAAKTMKSVAVLPFRVMSKGEDDGYFADGLTEEIINSLWSLQELMVTARTSSFHFKGQDLPVNEIGKTLGVDHIVEGSVRRSKDELRITAQLVRAEDGFHLWSQTYDRTLEDIFAVQEEIASSIAETLEVVLDADKLAVMRNSGFKDVEAFIAYQKGLELNYTAHLDMDNVADLLIQANEYFDRALEGNPGLTNAQILRTDRGTHILQDLADNNRQEQYPGEARETLQQIRAALTEARKYALTGNQRDILDVELAIFSDSWVGMSTKIEKALSPGICPVTNWTLQFASPYGFAEKITDKALDELRCDPLNPAMWWGLPNLYIAIGDTQSALRMADEGEALNLPQLDFDETRFFVYLANGEVESARALVDSITEELFYDPMILLYAMSGELEKAKALAELQWSDPEGGYYASLIIANLVGDRTRANHYAGLIDAAVAGAFNLAMTVNFCSCGAPFDLDAAPNFKARIEESGLTWPPVTGIKFPAKDW